MKPPPSATAFWSVPVEALFAELASSPRGLSEREAARRLAEVGPNVATLRAHTSPLRVVAAQFTSPITLLLLGAALLSIALGEQVDGGIILAILVVSGALGLWQERRASDAVERLLALVHTTATVVRDGADREIPVDAVVPGDVVRLSAGAAVPGDARLLEERDLYVDQSALTGESFPAEKSVAAAPADAGLVARTNVVHLGTHVVSGSALAVVARTGRATEFGVVAHRLALRPAETEFEHGVRRFGYLLLEAAMALAIAIFAVNVALHRPVLDALLFTLALTVGLTPQLLPAIVSVTLAQGARHMAAERVIVRRLASIEDLGGMQILCADKTGTITEGVVALHAAEDFAGAPSERVRLLAWLNAAFESGFANPIDETLRASPPDGATGWTKVDEVPYDFVRRRLSVAVAREGRRILVTKGAVASVLEVCTHAERANGEAVPIDEARDAIEARLEALSRDGHRALAVATKEIGAADAIGRDDERALTFAGIVSFSDPLKPRIVETIVELARLGIALKIVTGDNRHVATRVAEEAGIASPVVCTGDDLRHLGESALVSAAPRVDVFAEVEPSQKEHIILALRKSGLAVGYLGDGINDAGALHAADVGISVDSAADVTRQAADIVLLEKNLAVLAAGVREGRRAFANTLKYVFITTSANFGNMFSMAGASLMTAFLPLLPKQILLVNVLSDMPAMTIATDRLDPELVESPRRWSNRSIGRFMLAFGLLSSAFDYLTFLSLLALRVEPAVFRTGWFLESVLSEILILLVIRTRRVFVRSTPGPALLTASVAVGIATVLLPYTPLGPPLGFAPLPAAILALVVGIVALYAIVSDATKRLVMRKASL